MKSIRMIRALGIAIAAVSAMATSSYAEVDHYPGALCQQMWTSTEVVHRSGGTLYNPSSSDAVVTCPFSMDDGNVRYYKNVHVTVKDTDSSKAVECRVVSCDGTGCYAGPYGNSGISNTGLRTIALSATYRYRPNSITCSIPSVGHDGGFFLYTYRGEKN